MSSTDPPVGTTSPQDAEPSRQPQTDSMSGGRIVAIVAGGLLALIAAALIVGGLAVLVGHAVLRDDDGYLNAPTERLVTPTRALTAERVDLGDARGGDWLVDNLDATVRVRASLAGNAPVFVGIARDRDLDAYLRGVAHERVRDWDDGPVYARSAGARVPAAPATRDFWVASASGSGTQLAQWKAEGGDWGAVVMRADARRGVDADVRVGVKVGWIVWLGVGLLLAGLALGAGAGGLIWAGAHRREPRAPAAATPPAGPAA